VSTGGLGWDDAKGIFFILFAAEGVRNVVTLPNGLKPADMTLTAFLQLL
jgi:hypothetical protein